MTARQPAEELAAGYEALRAAAVGSLPTDTPKGLTLLLAQGLPGWIRAWTKPAVTRTPVRIGGKTHDAGGLGSEVVRLLAEMALGHRATVALP